MNVRIEPIADQHGILCISFNKEDYSPQVESQLKKLKKTAHIKGFRQGAVPDAMVQKLYGGELRSDIIHKLLNQTILDYQKTNELSFMGDLMEIPDANNFSDQESFEFKFEIGIAPKPDIDNLIKELKITKYHVIIPEERIDEEVQYLKEKMGESSETEELVQNNDIIEVDAFELDGDQIKTDGWNTQFPVAMGDLMHENFANAVSGLKKSDSFKFNIREVEKNLTEKDISKYLLKLPEDQLEWPGENFQGNITKVLRKQPAELSEELFTKAFGPETKITNEDQLRENYRKDLEAYFDTESSRLVDIELVKKIVKQSHMHFPDAFLIKWLKATYPEWQTKEGHDLEHEFLHFKEGMSWKLIREKILELNNTEIKYEDLISIVVSEIQMQYPGLQFSAEQWQELGKRKLSDKESSMHYFIEAQNQKALSWIKEQVAFDEEAISLEKFREKVKQINEHHH
jgi:trigger factor